VREDHETGKKRSTTSGVTKRSPGERHSRNDVPGEGIRSEVNPNIAKEKFVPRGKRRHQDSHDRTSPGPCSKEGGDAASKEKALYETKGHSTENN